MPTGGTIYQAALWSNLGISTFLSLVFALIFVLKAVQPTHTHLHKQTLIKREVLRFPHTKDCYSTTLSWQIHCLFFSQLHLLICHSTQRARSACSPLLQWNCRYRAATTTSLVPWETTGFCREAELCHHVLWLHYLKPVIPVTLKVKWLPPNKHTETSVILSKRTQENLYPGVWVLSLASGTGKEAFPRGKHTDPSPYQSPTPQAPRAELLFSPSRYRLLPWHSHHRTAAGICTGRCSQALLCPPSHIS